MTQNHYWVILQYAPDECGRTRWRFLVFNGREPEWTKWSNQISPPIRAMRYGIKSDAERSAAGLNSRGEGPCEVVQIKILRGSTEIGV